MIALLMGLFGGLQRIGWAELPASPSFAMVHGPLMVCGFLGTLISLERAVALGRLWAYLGPAFAGIGAILLIAGMGGWLPPALIVGGSMVLVAVFVRVLFIQFQPFAVVMAAGAVAWVVGNVIWLMGEPLYHVVLWWMGFLVLTIAGERLELSRMLMHHPRVQTVFLAIMGLFIAALIVSSFAPDAGTRMLGAVLIPLSVWLMRFDVARHTVRQQGLTQFIGWCLLAGYVWLIVSGAAMLFYGSEIGGTAYDAVLHAVFVGFVFSMIFGHAPIIFPSVLGVPVAYKPYFYAHLALLHVSLILRIVGDVSGIIPVRRWGGILNAAAILLFLGVTVASVAIERRRLRASFEEV